MMAGNMNAQQEHDSKVEHAVPDGMVKLQLANHSMRAVLEIQPGYTGDTAALLGFLKEHNVIYGVDNQSIAEALAQIRKFRKPVKVTAARGSAATDAVDGRIELKFSKAGRNTADAESEKNVDFREVSKIIPAKKDQLLAVLIPAKDSVMGTDVHGKAIPADKRRGIIPRLKSGRNVRQENNQYFAECDGLVKYSGVGIQVQEEFTVNNDVDFSVGNIRFTGNVTVNGNVRPGFSIEAAGNVSIAGEVNDARIISGGNVTVSHGIVGKGKSEIIAKGSVNAGFVENSRIEAGGAIKLRSHAMHSNLYADDVIQATTGKGAIIGGDTRSGKGIQVHIIGSESVQGTCVALGGGIKHDNQLRDYARQLTEFQQNMRKIQMTIGEAAFKRITDDPTQLRQMIIETRRPILQKLMDDYTKLQVKAAQLEEKIKELQSRIADIQTGVIQISQAAYQGSFISIGHLVMELKEDYQSAAFYGDFKEGAIKTR